MSEYSTCWISPETLSWTMSPAASSTYGPAGTERSYQLWDRGMLLISTANKDFDLADGISNLKRSLNDRLQTIEKLYSLKEIPLPSKPSGYLETLQYFGLVRPLLLRELIDVRNAIEHSDKKPPSQGRCQELVDIVWYFLKSTDLICQNLMETISLHKGSPLDAGDSLHLDFKDGPRHEVDIGASLAEPLARLEPIRDWIEIKARMCSLISRRSGSEGNIIEVAKTWSIGGIVDVDSTDLYRIYQIRFRSF